MEVIRLIDRQGFVKQVSIPPATSVRTKLSAPFIWLYAGKLPQGNPDL